MKVLRRLVLFLLLMAIVAGAAVWWVWRKANEATGTGEGAPRVVLVPTGGDLAGLVDTLQAQGLVEDVAFFQRWAELRKFSSPRPGRYVVEPGTSINDLVLRLRRGEQDPVRVTFTNVRTLDELAGRVARYLEPDSLALLEALRDTTLMREHELGPETSISLFLPNTYEFWWTTTPAAFVERMAREHDAFWEGARTEKAARLGLSPVEVSTLASIVQAETIKPDEAPRIAGVYLNRLRIGMPLQADPTLKFALGLDSVSRILDKDKLVDSPYNTYTHAGLPPGPINMPEPRNIDAVLNAERHDYLYFCARDDFSGYSDFAKSYAEHLRNARRYQRALNARRIYR